ncbi:unnamed protein product [Ectocarpus sp. 6 AP-2014]
MCETKATGRWRGQRDGDGKMLSKQDLDMIAAYKYKPGAYTHLDNLLTPFWNWAVTLLPMWMAPNLVTFIGLAGTCLASLLVTSYSPGLEGETVPSWCSLLFALALFLYQTLDAIDGKQARRTNSSSPLGQLFDHGCDAAVKVLCFVAMCATLEVGPTPNVMILFCIVEGVFYMAQWEEYHTGTLNWSNGYMGVTESQVIQMGLFVVSAFFGQGIWSTAITLPGTDLRVSVLQAMVWALIPPAIAMVSSNIRRVWASRPGDLPEEERGLKTIGVYPGVLQLLAMSAAMGLGIALSMGPALPVFVKHTGLQLFMLGTVTTHLTSQMIVHHMAKSALSLQDVMCPSLLVLAAVTLNVYLPTLGLGETSPMDPEKALYLGSGIAMASYLRYVSGAISDICWHLDIQCFRIKHSSGNGKKEN